VRDANGQALAYVYGRATEADALQAKVLTEDVARMCRSWRTMPGRPSGAMWLPHPDVHAFISSDRHPWGYDGLEILYRC
jgi:hypothetical protein